MTHKLIANDISEKDLIAGSNCFSFKLILLFNGFFTAESFIF
jgi:hypothetical protein